MSGSAHAGAEHSTKLNEQVPCSLGLARLGSEVNSLRCTFNFSVHRNAPTFRIVRQGGAVASYESRGGRRQQHLCLLTNRLWYTLQRLKSTHTPKKVRFVFWTHRQKMPTTRPTIAVNSITIFAGTRAARVDNTKLQPSTRGISNVEPDMALTLDADMTLT